MAKLKVYLKGDCREIEAPDHQTLLMSNLDQGIYPPFGCMAGICHACKARLLQGEVKYESQDFKMSKSEIDSKMILTCQAKPKSQELEIEYPDESKLEN